MDPAGPAREMEVLFKGRNQQDLEEVLCYVKRSNDPIRLCSSPLWDGTKPNAKPKMVNSTKAKMIITG